MVDRFVRTLRVLFIPRFGWLVVLASLTLYPFGDARASCTRYLKMINVETCHSRLEYVVEVNMKSAEIDLTITFQNTGATDVYFLADWPPIIGSDHNKRSFDIMFGQPALQQSELPRLVRVASGDKITRRIRVPVASGTSFIRYLSVTIFFATKHPGFFRRLDKSKDHDHLHWFTSDGAVQRTYNKLVRSDTVEMNVDE